MTQRAPMVPMQATPNGTTAPKPTQARQQNLIVGRFRGRCTGINDFTVGYSNGGTEQVGLVFAIVEGEHSGRRFPKYFTVDDEDGVERLRKALQACGWDGGSLTELKGIDSRDVELVIDAEEYDGVKRSRLQFVNGLAQANMKTPMVGEQRVSFLRGLGDRMKGGPSGSSSGSSKGASEWDDEANLPPEAHRSR